MYTYTKGKGWIYREPLASTIRTYNGKRYRVDLYGELQSHSRGVPAIMWGNPPQVIVEQVPWMDAWDIVPPGFGVAYVYAENQKPQRMLIETTLLEDE